MLAEYKRLIKMRKDNAVLRRGSIDAPLHADANVVVLLRELGGVVAVTATNNAQQAQRVTVRLPAKLNGVTLTHALTGAKSTVTQNELTLEIPALYGVVLLNTQAKKK